jgi:hypothetical protein
MSSRARFRPIALVASVVTMMGACSSEPQTSQAPPPPAAAAAYEGFHDGADCQTIRGWVWDRNQPGVPLSVQIFDGTTPLATVRADIRRPDLAAAGKSDGQHSFSWPVPESLRDGQPHSISVSVAGSSFRLGNSPKTLQCP